MPVGNVTSKNCVYIGIIITNVSKNIRTIAENEYICLGRSLLASMLPYSHFFDNGIIGTGTCIFSKVSWPLISQNIFFIYLWLPPTSIERILSVFYFCASRPELEPLILYTKCITVGHFALYVYTFST